MSLRLEAIESQTHAPFGEEGAEEPENPPRGLHVEEVLDAEDMGNVIEGLQYVKLG